jgi:transcriptional regulator GlxA family with amidase domain
VRHAKLPAMDIDVLIFDGFDELDAVAPFEVLATAAALGGPFSVALAGVDGTEPVTASHGMRVLPDRAAGTRRPDLIVVPGGGWTAPGVPGARAQVERGKLPPRIAAWHADGIRIGSVCTGGLIVAASGLLEGRPATTHHGALEDLAGYGARVVPGRVVDDGDVITSGGVTSGLDFALWIVEQEAGAELADRVAAEIEYERRAVGEGG